MEKGGIRFYLPLTGESVRMLSAYGAKLRARKLCNVPLTKRPNDSHAKSDELAQFSAQEITFFGCAFF